MNIVSEDQAAARQLALPPLGLLEDLSPEFIAELQTAGAFVEYNQQVVVVAGELVDYVSCLVAGRVKISRLDADYGKAEVARLGAGDWFGETISSSACRPPRRSMPTVKWSCGPCRQTRCGICSRRYPRARSCFSTSPLGWRRN